MENVKSTDYSVRKVAQLMDCTATTVRTLIALGKLRAYKLGGGDGPWRIPQAELDRVRNDWAVKPDTTSSTL